MNTKISVGFVYFRTTNLTHLDAAWYSLSRQDFSDVNGVWFLDNNTDDSPEKIYEVLARYPLPVPVWTTCDKHGDLRRTQSWSVNTVVRQTLGPWVFFTRSDYVLAFDCLSRFREHARWVKESGKLGQQQAFITSWCWQMAYDAHASNTDGYVDIEQYGWRERGMVALLEHPYAIRFHDTSKDAGVWLMRRESFDRAGGLNESLVAWGFQQSSFQRLLEATGTVCLAIPDYLFAHQHHYAERNFQVAAREFNEHGRG